MEFEPKQHYEKSPTNNDDDVIDLKKIRAHYTTVEEIDQGCYFCLKSHEPDFPIMEFGLFQFHTSWEEDEYEEKTLVNRIFSGSGTTQNLRELRHIWWGDEDGYTYCIPGKAVIEALKRLEEFFDI